MNLSWYLLTVQPATELQTEVMMESILDSLAAEKLYQSGGSNLLDLEELSDGDFLTNVVSYSVITHIKRVAGPKCTTCVTRNTPQKCEQSSILYMFSYAIFRTLLNKLSYCKVVGKRLTISKSGEDMTTV